MSWLVFFLVTIFLCAWIGTLSLYFRNYLRALYHMIRMRLDNRFGADDPLPQQSPQHLNAATVVKTSHVVENPQQKEHSLPEAVSLTDNSENQKSP